MNRIQLACCFLLCTAFVLAGLLMTRLGSNTAYAEQVMSQGTIVLLTARTQSNEESLFVIDNTTARLLILKADANRDRMELMRMIDLDDLFSAPAERDRGRGR